MWSSVSSVVTARTEALWGGAWLLCKSAKCAIAVRMIMKTLWLYLPPEKCVIVWLQHGRMQSRNETQGRRTDTDSVKIKFMVSLQWFPPCCSLQVWFRGRCCQAHQCSFSLFKSWQKLSVKAETFLELRGRSRSVSFAGFFFCLCLNPFSPVLSLSLFASLCLLLSVSSPSFHLFWCCLFSLSLCVCTHVSVQRGAPEMWLSLRSETSSIIKTAHYLPSSHIKIYLHTQGHNLIAHLHNNYGCFIGLVEPFRKPRIH